MDRIGVISDTHGDQGAWEQALAGPFAGAALILHAGDLLYHGPRNPMPSHYGPAGLAHALNQSPVPMVIARGNCDSDVDQLAIDWPIQAPYAFVQYEGLRLLVNHGDGLSREQMIEMGQRFRVQFFICGHTHECQLETVGDLTLFNPGSPSLPKRAFAGVLVPTVAVIEDGVARMIDLRTGEQIAA